MANLQRSSCTKRWLPRRLKNNIMGILFLFLLADNLYYYVTWHPIEKKRLLSQNAEEQNNVFPLNWNLGAKVQDEIKKKSVDTKIPLQAIKNEIAENNVPPLGVEAQYEIKEKSSEDKAAKVIVVGLESEGTSLVGQVFSSSQEVLFHNEPLQSIIEEYKNRKGIKVDEDLYVKPDGSFRRIPQMVEKAMSNLAVELLNCRYDNIPRSALYHDFILKARSHGYASYQECMKYPDDEDTEPIPKVEYHDNRLDKCISILQQQCLNSAFVVISTVHATAEQLYRILEDDSDIKIVRVVRDARNVVTDRKLALAENRSREVTSQEVQDITIKYCTRLRYENRQMFDITENYWQNIISVVFEEFTEKALSITKDIYRLIDRSVPKDVVLFLESGFDDVKEQDPNKFDIEKWKSHLKGTALRVVSNECHQ